MRSEGLVGWSVSREERRQLFHCSFDILLMTAANEETLVMKRDPILIQINQKRKRPKNE
jgi:hypothetical protein